MSRIEQLQGATTTTENDREGPVRRAAFRALAWLLSLWVLLMNVFGLTEPVLMWLPDRTVGAMVGGGGAESLDLTVHRSHFMAVGILAWAVVLPTLVQLRRPERRVSSMLFLVVLALASLVVFGLTGTFGEWVLEEWTWTLPVLALAALHPRARDLVRPTRHDRAQLVLAAVALVPWAVYVTTMLVAQVSRDDVHASEEHWAIAALVGVIVVAGSFVGAGHRSGWRLPAGIAAAASLLFGAHTLVFPDLASGLPTVWALAAVAWGLAYATASVARARRNAPATSAAPERAPVP